MDKVTGAVIVAVVLAGLLTFAFVRQGDASRDACPAGSTRFESGSTKTCVKTYESGFLTCMKDAVKDSDVEVLGRNSDGLLIAVADVKVQLGEQGGRVVAERSGTTDAAVLAKIEQCGQRFAGGVIQVIDSPGAQVEVRE